MAEDKPTVHACPECGKEFDGPGKVTFHRVAAHGYRAANKDGAKSGGGKDKRRTPEHTPAAPTSAELAKIIDDAVVNMRGLGALLHQTVAPHAGLAIAGWEVEKGAQGAFEEGGKFWIVRSRAVMLQPGLVDQCKREPRLLRVLQAFNLFCSGSVAVEAVGGVLAGAAVDGGLSPDLEFKIMRARARPVQMLIPDVLEFVAVQRAAEDAAAGGQPPPVQAGPASNGQHPEEEAVETVELVEGDVTAT